MKKQKVKPKKEVDEIPTDIKKKKRKADDSPEKVLGTPVKKKKTEEKLPKPEEKKQNVKPKKEPENHDASAMDTTETGTPVEKKKFNYMAYKAKLDAGPKNAGSKEIPTGAENCLEGLIFVITGTGDSLGRDETKSLIERYGGKVTSAVSG